LSQEGSLFLKILENFKNFHILLKNFHRALGLKILNIFDIFRNRGRSIERPLLINGYAYLAVSLLDNGQVDSDSYVKQHSQKTQADSGHQGREMD
jgi:hypothetical protein